MFEELHNDLRRPSFKIFAQLECQFLIEKENVETHEIVGVLQPIFLSARTAVLSRGDDISEFFLSRIAHPINSKFDEFSERDSGKSLASIVALHVSAHLFEPFAHSASSYLPLPASIARRRAVINVQNQDEKCFLWALASALFRARQPPHITIFNSNRTATYQTLFDELENSLDLRGISWPMPVHEIKRFERQNSSFSFNVFTLEFDSTNKSWKVVGPVHFSGTKKENHFNFLLIHGDGGRSHYVWIKHLGRLIQSQHSEHKGRIFVCDRCLNVFRSQRKFEAHDIDCRSVGSPARLILPSETSDEEERFMEFRHVERQQRCPIAVYVDFEALTVPVSSCEPSSNGSFLQPYQIHEPFSAALQVVCSFDESRNQLVAFHGPDVARQLLAFLEGLAKDYEQLLSCPSPLVMHDEDEEAFQNSDVCHICKGPFLPNSVRVRDHDHFSGVFRGAAHQACNVNFPAPTIIPVVMHNGSGYDWHFLLQAWGEKNCMNNDGLRVVPHNHERFVAISQKIGKVELRFLDSLKFLGASLDSLSRSLDSADLRFTRAAFPDDRLFALARRKGVFPYDYVNDVSKLDETRCPPPEAFYSRLTDTPVSDSEYAHAQAVWDAFSVQNLGEYADLYLKIDVLLETDTMETFRNVCLEVYGLDPLFYYTAPGLSWDAMLKTTGVRLELLTDIDMVLFFERGIRGGLVQVIGRHAEANHPFVGDRFRPDDKPSYLAYVDANNLYGFSMSHPLPVGDFRWMPESDIERLNIAEAAAEVDRGYVLEVDLDYPDVIHDRLSDLPPCPETRVPPDSKSRQVKLLATLLPKRRYVVHIRNLLQALELGVQLTKIHRVVSFSQRPWLATYMDLNNARRQRASSDFEDKFFKLMNNSIYGKSMEDVRNHRRIYLVNKWEGKCGARRLIADPAFVRSHHVNGDLMTIELRKTEVKLTKPIYLGFCILEISKHRMYDFYYSYCQKHLCDLHLLYMDTDSFILSTSTSVYAEMNRHPSWFDTSCFGPDNAFGVTPRNKKVLGLFKDECGNDPLLGYVGLRPKMYSIETRSRACSSRAKGVQRSVVKRYKFQNYLDCLFRNESRIDKQCIIRSKSHINYSFVQNKRSLSVSDDKRYWIDKFTSLPWGHFRIQCTRPSVSSSSSSACTLVPAGGVQ